MIDSLEVRARGGAVRAQFCSAFGRAVWARRAPRRSVPTAFDPHPTGGHRRPQEGRVLLRFPLFVTITGHFSSAPKSLSTPSTKRCRVTRMRGPFLKWRPLSDRGVDWPSERAHQATTLPSSTTTSWSWTRIPTPSWLDAGCSSVQPMCPRPVRAWWDGPTNPWPTRFPDRWSRFRPPSILSPLNPRCHPGSASMSAIALGLLHEHHTLRPMPPLRPGHTATPLQRILPPTVGLRASRPSRWWINPIRSY